MSPSSSFTPAGFPSSSPSTFRRSTYETNAASRSFCSVASSRPPLSRLRSSAPPTHFRRKSSRRSRIPIRPSVSAPRPRSRTPAPRRSSPSSLRSRTRTRSSRAPPPRRSPGSERRACPPSQRRSSRSPRPSAPAPRSRSGSSAPGPPRGAGLLRALADPDAYVRWCAANALGAAGLASEPSSPRSASPSRRGRGREAGRRARARTARPAGMAARPVVGRDARDDREAHAAPDARAPRAGRVDRPRPRTGRSRGRAHGASPTRGRGARHGRDALRGRVDDEARLRRVGPEARGGGPARPRRAIPDAGTLPEQPERLRITPRMVLSHTSGLPNWRKGGEERDGPLPVIAEPGSRFGYPARRCSCSSGSSRR